MKNNLIKTGAIVSLSAIGLISLPIIRSYDKSSAADAVKEYTLFGDINSDDVVDVFDIVTLRKKIADKKTDKQCDLDLNGKIDEKDLLLLSDFVHGGGAIYDSYAVLDTDEDGLKDIDELMYTKTSPYDNYSNGTIDSKKNSVSDADADLDGDGLSNVKEIEIGTDPLSDDTDYDGLTDNDELTKYKTEPTKYDTDEDGVSDGDEIALKLDPLKASTNGTTEDNEITTSQKIDAASDVLAKVNQDNPFNMSIDIDAAGIAANNTIVTLSRYYCAIPNEFLIGEPIEVTYNDDLLIESATISFNLDDDAAKNVEADDCMIFKYDIDSKCLLPVKTEYKDNTLYTESKELGTYCVFNVSEYEKQLLNNQYINKSNIDDIEVLFLVDVSANCNDALEETKSSIYEYCKYIFSVSSNTTVSIFGYYETLTDITKPVYFGDDYKITSIDGVEKAMKELKAETTYKKNDTNIGIFAADSLSENLFSEKCKNKYVYILSDSPYSFDNTLGYSVTITTSVVESLEKIYDRNTHLSFILSDYNYKKANATNNLIESCKQYGFNVYSRSESNVFDISIIADVFKKSFIDNGVCCMNGLTPVAVPDSLDYHKLISGLPSNIDISKLPASDKNGKIDTKTALSVCNIDWKSYFEICQKNRDYDNGLHQFVNQVDKKVSYLYASMPFLPYNDTDYSVKGNKNFIKVTGNYYAPPTFYEDIVPVSPEHEEGVNGRTVNGVWEDWR